MNITPKYVIFDSNNRLIGGAKTIESAEKQVTDTDNKIFNLETKQYVINKENKEVNKEDHIGIHLG